VLKDRQLLRFKSSKDKHPVDSIELNESVNVMPAEGLWYDNRMFDNMVVEKSILLPFLWLLNLHSFFAHTVKRTNTSG
jgi:hypothetical protein